MRYLHFVDNTQAPRAGSADYNKLYKIQPFLYKTKLTMDETLIKFIGLAESCSGYLLNSKIYTGKEGNAVVRDLGRKAVNSGN